MNLDDIENIALEAGFRRTKTHKALIRLAYLAAARAEKPLVDAINAMYASTPPYRADGTPTIPDKVVEQVNAALAKVVSDEEVLIYRGLK